MDDSLYDEFGNYIGPELSGSDEASPLCSAWKHACMPLVGSKGTCITSRALSSV